jgi:hypothetical protein
VRCLKDLEKHLFVSVCYKYHVVSKITIIILPTAGKTKFPTLHPLRELVMPDNDNHLSGGDGFYNGENTIQDILACEL